MTTETNQGLSAHEMLEDPNSPIVVIGQILCVIIPLVIWFAPLEIDPTTQHALAIIGFMVVAWITRAMDYALAGMIGCFLFWALRIVRFPIAFSGFANDTAWFVFGALLLGVMATQSGIARRLAYFIMLKVGTTYPRILFGLIATDFLLTFIVPSGIARVVIMASIAIGLAEAFNSPPGTNVSRGMFLVLTYTANIFDKMIIAGAGSITARGLIEKVGGFEVLWSYWFIAFLPCSIITVLAAWWLTLWLYPPETVTLEGGREHLQNELKKMGPLSPKQRRAAIFDWLGGWIVRAPPTDRDPGYRGDAAAELPPGVLRGRGGKHGRSRVPGAQKSSCAARFPLLLMAKGFRIANAVLVLSKRAGKYEAGETRWHRHRR